jgi:hypothetical protein
MGLEPSQVPDKLKSEKHDQHDKVGVIKQNDSEP